MRKLKLDLDQVRVVSFTMMTVQGSRGTVNGFAPDARVGWGGIRSPTDGDLSCRICFPEPITVNLNYC